MTNGVVPKEAIIDTVQVAKAAQIAAFVRENQILTAVVCFALWQAGIFFTAIDHAQGAIC